MCKLIATALSQCFPILLARFICELLQLAGPLMVVLLNDLYTFIRTCNITHSMVFTSSTEGVFNFS